MLIRSFVATALVAVAGLAAAPVSAQSAQPPTATEAFRLRQLCDQRAQKWAADVTAAAGKVAGITSSTSAVWLFLLSCLARRNGILSLILRSRRNWPAFHR